MSRLLAFVYDHLIDAPERACLAEWRHALLAGATGDVLEVGAGTGRNLAHYPPSARLVASEPDEGMRRRLARRAAELGRPVEIVAAPIERLPFPDERFDVVVCTLVLCSVEDPAAALAEVRRVLRPGGRLLFLEHVASPDPGRLRWQRRVEPVWRRLLGNCHLTRRTEEAIRAAGFEIVDAQRESMRKTMALARPSVRGVALRGAIGHRA